MSALAFKGTSIEQDPRWAKARAKRKKAMKFPAIFAAKVDMSRINVEQFKKWTEKRLVELFDGLEDEILINYVHGYLEQPVVDPEDMLMSLNDMLERDTVTFMEELWTLLVDAQNNAAGIPKAFLDATKSNVDVRMQERDRITQGMHHSGHSHPFIKHHLPEDLFQDPPPRSSRDDRYGLDVPPRHRSGEEDKKLESSSHHQTHRHRDSDYSHHHERSGKYERSHRDNYHDRRESGPEGSDSSRVHRQDQDDYSDDLHYTRDRRPPRDRPHQDQRFRGEGRPRDRDGRPYDSYDRGSRPDFRHDRRRGGRYNEREDSDVDIFGRDARPSRENHPPSVVTGTNGTTSTSSTMSRGPEHRYSDGSPSLAEEYASASLQSKKRSHEPHSDEELDFETKRAKRA